MEKESQRILIVDDNELNREILDSMLQKEYSTVEARNGQEALDILKYEKASITAILLDIVMPKMDGYEATRTIRNSSHPNAKQIPIIAMTADAFTSDVSACLACGMNDHVAKPIDRTRLFHVLAEQIKKFRKEGE